MAAVQGLITHKIVKFCLNSKELKSTKSYIQLMELSRAQTGSKYENSNISSTVLQIPLKKIKNYSFSSLLSISLPVTGQISLFLNLIWNPLVTFPQIRNTSADLGKKVYIHIIDLLFLHHSSTHPVRFCSTNFYLNTESFSEGSFVFCLFVCLFVCCN